jgi:hypothetical protein
LEGELAFGVCWGREDGVALAGFFGEVEVFGSLVEQIAD